uniref:Uncharacterized protein n=1 Tax=Rhizophora mucronata TaxID=61149 RepID=A0A2P2LKD2_RHIMU
MKKEGKTNLEKKSAHDTIASDNHHQSTLIRPKTISNHFMSIRIC